MSWYVQKTGTFDAVASAVAEAFEKSAVSYDATNPEEAADIRATAARAAQAIAAIKASPNGANGARVDANGSRSSGTTSLKCEVTPQYLAL